MNTTMLHLKKAFNESFKIPERSGVHVLYKVPSTKRLIIRIAMLHPKPCPGIYKVIIGENHLDTFDLNRETIFVVEPDQVIGVHTLMSKEGRRLEITGYIEPDRDLCSDVDLPEDPWAEPTAPPVPPPHPPPPPAPAPNCPPPPTPGGCHTHVIALGLFNESSSPPPATPDGSCDEWSIIAIVPLGDHFVEFHWMLRSDGILVFKFVNDTIVTINVQLSISGEPNQYETLVAGDSVELTTSKDWIEHYKNGGTYDLTAELDDYSSASINTAGGFRDTDGILSAFDLCVSPSDLPTPTRVSRAYYWMLDQDSPADGSAPMENIDRSGIRLTVDGTEYTIVPPGDVALTVDTLEEYSDLIRDEIERMVSDDGITRLSSFTVTIDTSSPEQTYDGNGVLRTFYPFVLTDTDEGVLSDPKFYIPSHLGGSFNVVGRRSAENSIEVFL